MGFISEAISGAANRRHERDMQIRENEMEKLRMAENQKYMEQMQRQAAEDRAANLEILKGVSDRNTANLDSVVNAATGGKGDSTDTVSDAASAKSPVSPGGTNGNASSNGAQIHHNHVVGKSGPDGADIPAIPSKQALVTGAAGNPH